MEDLVEDLALFLTGGVVGVRGVDDCASRARELCARITSRLRAA